MQDKPLLIDNIDAGKLLSMPSTRVARLAKRGDLPCVVLPDGELRYSVDDLKTWIDHFRQPAQAEGGK
jgi:hypothetical protein